MPFESEVARLRRLLDETRAGSREAAAELVDRFSREIATAVRSRLPSCIRTLFDPEDFTQAVWGDFFPRVAAGERFDSPRSLVAFLQSTGRRKVLAAYRDQTRGKRDVRRQVPLDSPSVSPDRDLVAPAPGPERVAMLRDEAERALQGLRPRCQRGARMLAAGHTFEEVADTVRLPARAVSRLLRGHQQGPAQWGRPSGIG
jgi:RNA polymerase sigma factor (sigma-70 family)